MSGLAERVRHWRPRTPLLPPDLARLVKPDDPDWFAREMAIAAAPPWWFWTFVLRNFSWLVSDANRARYRIAAAITRGLVPLRSGEVDRPLFVDRTRPATAVAAYPGGVVPEDIP